jgi:hypothetical protein
VDDRKADKLVQLDQLEKSIEESEKDFPLEQISGEIKKYEECVIEGEVISGMTKKNIENKENQEKVTESKLEEIAPINKDINQDEKFSNPC